MADQTKFEDVVNSWEAFLKGSRVRYIRIQNMENGRFVMDRTKGALPSMFFMEDILKTHKGIGPWFDDILIKHNLKEVKMLFRKKSGSNGTANEPRFTDTIYKTSGRLEYLKSNNHSPMQTATEVPVKTIAAKSPVPDMTTMNPSQHHYPPSPPVNYPVQSQNGLGAATMNALGGLGQAALAAGMGLPELIEVKKKADRADEYKDKLRKLEEEHHSLTIRNRELESKVSIAEQSQDIAVKLAKLENKGFMDSAAVQKIIESLPSVIGMMANNNGQQPGGQPIGLSAGSQLSEAKAKIMGYIEDDMCTDAMATILERCLYLLATSPIYTKELNELNSKEYGSFNGNG